MKVQKYDHPEEVLFNHTSTCTGWRRLIGSPKLRIIFHKRATKYRSLLRKMTYKDKGSYESSPPCNTSSYEKTYKCKENIFTCIGRYLHNDTVHTARVREDETQDGHRNSKRNPEWSNSGFFPFEISCLMMMIAFITFKVV